MADASKSIQMYNRVWRQGEAIPQGLVNAIVAQLVGMLTPSGQLSATSSGRMALRAKPTNGAFRILPGKITTTATSTLHEWKQQEPKDDGTDWQDAQGGVDATIAGPIGTAAKARTIDGSMLTADTKVFVAEAINHNGFVSYWILGGGGNTLPTPTALYQVLQCSSFTSSTVFTLIFDWVRAH